MHTRCTTLRKEPWKQRDRGVRWDLQQKSSSKEQDLGGFCGNLCPCLNCSFVFKEQPSQITKMNHTSARFLVWSWGTPLLLFLSESDVFSFKVFSKFSLFVSKCFHVHKSEQTEDIISCFPCCRGSILLSACYVIEFHPSRPSLTGPRLRITAASETD